MDSLKLHAISTAIGFVLFFPSLSWKTIHITLIIIHFAANQLNWTYQFFIQYISTELTEPLSECSIINILKKNNS